MGKHLLNNPAELKDFLKRWETNNTQTLDGDTQEAIAEAYFRLGVHTDTPSNVALNYLHQAFKRDGTNPKYAYHLGRLYFLHNKMEQAGDWLSLAARLCPTSHRMWTHISLLQSELNGRYKGDTEYEEDVLKKRGEEIIKIIRDGRDDFKPEFLNFQPPRALAAIEAEGRKKGIRPNLIRDKIDKDGKSKSISFKPVTRTSDKERCRWTGIYDLQAEEGFQSSASERSRNILYLLLEETANLREKRKHGISAFVVLAVEWLVTGYPVATIRRLGEQLPKQSDSKALELLEAVCVLYEAEEDELPRLLAEGLEAKRIPPLLVALVHQQRLLWRPLEYKQTSTYRAARKFLENGRKASPEDEDILREEEERLLEYKKSLDKGIKALLNPSPPDPMEDVPSKLISLIETFTELEQKSSKLKEISNEGFGFLKQHLVSHVENISDDASYSQTVANRSAFDQLLASIERAGKVGGERLKKLPASDARKLGEDFGKRVKTCRNTFDHAGTLSNFEKALKEVDKQLKSKSQDFNVTQTSASTELETFIQTVNDLFPEDQAVQSAEDEPFTPEIAKETLVELEETSCKLKQISDESFLFLKQQLVPYVKNLNDDASCSQAQADRSAFNDLLAGFEEAGKVGVEKLNTLSEQIHDIDPKTLGEDFGKRIENCRNTFNAVATPGNFKKILNKKVDKQLESKSQDFNVTQTSASTELDALIQAINDLFPEDQAVQSAEDEPFTPEIAKETLVELEETSCKLKQISDESFLFLKQQLVPYVKNLNDDASCSQAQADRSAFNDLLAGFEEAGKVGVEKLNTLSEQIHDIDPKTLGEDFGKRIENCRNTFNAVATPGNFKKILNKKVDKQLESKSQDFNVTPTPVSTELDALIQAINDLFPELKIEQKAEKNELANKEKTSSGEKTTILTNESVETDEQQSSHNGLAKTIETVDREIDKLFSSMNETFDVYSPESKQLLPIQSLYAIVRTREAETYYRMGHRCKARQLWNAILLDDRLNLAALKNIAVCDTNDPDISRTLSSWRAYCEMLYLQAVIAGDPRYRAKERAEFHQNFASAFAPEALIAELDNNWPDKLDKDSAISFLENPARFRAYVDHTLLAFYNRKLDFSSPTLILGVSRSEREEVRIKAKEALELFTAEVRTLLPNRASKPFSSVCRDHFETALNVSKRTEGLTLKSDPNYTNEQDLQLHWVADLWKLLYKYYGLLNLSEETLHALNSFDCLEQFDRLTRVPIKLSQPFFFQSAQAIPVGDPDEFLGQFDKIKQNIIFLILESIFQDEDNSETKSRQRQYQRLVKHWVKHPMLEEYLDWIDNPQHFYPKVILEALKSGKDDPSATTELRKWHQQYPELSGPARFLAIMLSRQKKVEEAISILEGAIGKTFSQNGRDECQSLLDHLSLQHNIKAGNFDEAISQLKRAKIEEPENLLEQLATIYSHWIQNEPDHAIELISQIADDFDWWQEQCGGTVEEKVNDTALEYKRQLMASAASIKLQISQRDRTILREVNEALSLVLRLDKDNLQAQQLKDKIS